MKLNYSLTTGFATCDGTTPSRDNTDSWIAWLPASPQDISSTSQLGGTFYLTPRSAPGLDENTVLLGVALGDLAGVQLGEIDPQQLSYSEGAAATVDADAVSLEAVQVIAAQNGPARRAAQAAFAEVPGERQFHIMPELF